MLHRREAILRKTGGTKTWHKKGWETLHYQYIYGTISIRSLMDVSKNSHENFHFSLAYPYLEISQTGEKKFEACFFLFICLPVYLGSGLPYLLYLNNRRKVVENSLWFQNVYISETKN